VNKAAAEEVGHAQEEKRDGLRDDLRDELRDEKKESEEHVRDLLSQAHAGDAFACFTLGLLYKSGKGFGVANPSQEAAKWQKRAAELGGRHPDKTPTPTTDKKKGKVSMGSIFAQKEFKKEGAEGQQKQGQETIPVIESASGSNGKQGSSSYEVEAVSPLSSSPPTVFTVVFGEGSFGMAFDGIQEGEEEEQDGGRSGEDLNNTTSTTAATATTTTASSTTTLAATSTTAAATRFVVTISKGSAKANGVEVGDVIIGVGPAIDASDKAQTAESAEPAEVEAAAARAAAVRAENQDRDHNHFEDKKCTLLPATTTYDDLLDLLIDSPKPTAVTFERRRQQKPSAAAVSPSAMLSSSLSSSSASTEMRGEDDKVAVAEMGAVIEDLEEEEEEDDDEDVVELTNGIKVTAAAVGAFSSSSRHNNSPNRILTLDSVVDGENNSGGGSGGRGGGGDAPSSPVRFSTSKVLFASPEPMAKPKSGERNLLEDQLIGNEEDGDGEHEDDDGEADEEKGIGDDNGDPTTAAAAAAAEADLDSSTTTTTTTSIDPNESLLGFLLCLSRAVGSYERALRLGPASFASSPSSSRLTQTFALSSSSPSPPPPSSSSFASSILSPPQEIKRNEANGPSPSSLSSATVLTAVADTAVGAGAVGAVSSVALKSFSVEVPLKALRRLVTDCFADGEQKEVSDGEIWRHTHTHAYTQTTTMSVSSNPHVPI
jgi:hypothetical protein